MTGVGHNSNRLQMTIQVGRELEGGKDAEISRSRVLALSD